jgi:hypothetical protein
MKNYIIKEDLLLQSLNTTNYLIVNKTLINYFGVEAALFLSNLIDKYFYFKEHNRLKEGWFYILHKNQTKQIGLSLHKLRKCKKQLINENIISTKMVGTPAKEHYFIHVEHLLTRINTRPTDFGRSSPTDFGRSSPTDFGRAYNINNNKVNNNKVLKYNIVENDFKNFWKLYPRKDKEGSALKAWINLCNSPSKKKYCPTWRQVVKAIILQKKTERWSVSKFIPLASTWLNQYRWLDDPKEMKLHMFKDDINNEQEIYNNIPDYVKQST